MRTDAAGLGIFDVAQPLGRPGVENHSAVSARARANVHDPVGTADDLNFMLYDKDRISRALEVVECVQQRLRVGGMKAADGSSST